MEFFKSDKFADRVKAVMAKNHIVGVSMAMVQDATIETRAFGSASLEPEKACTPDTLFDLASASKSMTAAAVALLVHDKEKFPDVEWTTPMSKLLPEDFVMSEEEYTKNITVEDVISHRTGLPRHDLSYVGPKAKVPDDAKSVTRNLRNLKLASPLRTTYQYCNIMYTVATYLVENLTNSSFADFLETRFFAPLEMTCSSLQPAAARQKGWGDRIATGYEWDKETSAYKSIRAPDCPEAQGAGSIITNASDYAKWVRALMNNQGPISEDVYKSMVRQRTITKPDAEGLPPFTSPKVYTAGLEMKYYRGHQIISHDGAIAGFGSTHFWLPEFKFGGVIQGNSGYTYKIAAVLVNELIDELIKVPEDQRVDWDKYYTEKFEKAEADSPVPTIDVIRQEFNPELKENEPLTRSLETYVGVYHSAGYGELEVQIKDGKLFIDADDRSFGFTLTMVHVCEQTKFAANLVCGEDFGGEDFGYVKAEFEFEDDRATKLGIDLDEDIGEYIRFTRK